MEEYQAGLPSENERWIRYLYSQTGSGKEP